MRKYLSLSKVLLLLVPLLLALTFPVKAIPWDTTSSPEANRSQLQTKTSFNESLFKGSFVFGGTYSGQINLGVFGTFADDCDQKDDSNGLDEGFNILSSSNFRVADDFFVSAGNTLNVQSIEVNIAGEPVTSLSINFYEDD